MLTYTSAGESHGKCLTVIVENFPAGIAIDTGVINAELKRRQGGYGRGGRMAIETDRIEITSGVKNGVSIGSPITLMIKNKDVKIDTAPPVYAPRPGHADLAGAMKYDFEDMRCVLERASARETAARVAVGGLCKILLDLFDITVAAYVIQIGHVSASETASDPVEIIALRDKSPLYTIDTEADEKMIRLIDETKRKGDTLGGIIKVVAVHIPPGLGSHTSPQKKLDGRLAAALMSIPAVKGVEIGLGYEAASRFGSEVHDEIVYNEQRKDASFTGYARKTNNAGGIEGGITNGENIVATAAMKPIPTLTRPLKSVDIRSKEAVDACKERSDVCAVPACSVVGEAVVRIELARVLLEKFGCDTISDIHSNFDSYIARLTKRF